MEIFSTQHWTIGPREFNWAEKTEKVFLKTRQVKYLLNLNYTTVLTNKLANKQCEFYETAQGLLRKILTKEQSFCNPYKTYVKFSSQTKAKNAKKGHKMWITSPAIKMFYYLFTSLEVTAVIFGKVGIAGIWKRVIKNYEFQGFFSYQTERNPFGSVRRVCCSYYSSKYLKNFKLKCN